MNRLLIGILCGIVFGIADALMVVFGKQPDKTTSVILQAFFSRFAIGVLAANVSFRLHPALSGAIVGLLISLPDALAMKSYVGILGTGLIFGALTGWAAMSWARQDRPQILMIVNFATAKHISGLMLDISRRLDESIALLRGTCSPEKIQSVSTRNGKSLAKILLEMLNPLYSKHTSLRLSELKGPESVL